MERRLLALEEVVSEFGADGKYIVFQRGKGIRGMKEVAQYGPCGSQPSTFRGSTKNPSGCQSLCSRNTLYQC